MTPLPPDPYKILGVSKDAQIPEIRSAHRKLVLKCHPDKVQDPKLKAEKQDEFQKVQQAYELLSDDNERQRYDDQVKLAELRKQFQAKANISTPRSSPKEYNVYTAEPARSTAKPGRSPPPVSKTYTTFSRSWEDEIGRGPRIFDAGPPRSSRREAGYVERPSKREVERERERERDARDREKERERDRRRRAEDARRAEKDAKEVRRAEKKQREKQRDKEIKREADEKKRYAKPYIETFDDEAPALNKKKSSSKKYEEKRDRSSGREDGSSAMPPPPPPPPPGPQRSYSNLDFATSYIEASRAKNGGLQRSATYHSRNVQPPAPTPPPVVGQSSPFGPPDEDVRRSSAKARRGSGDDPRLSRERSYRASSREPLDDPIVLGASPTSRHTAQFQRPAATTPAMPNSPPRRELPRTSTMPVDAAFARPVPPITRAHTFNALGEAAPRGRERSRMHPQIEEESDSDDAYDRRAHDRKHRSSRRHRSPEAPRPEKVNRYQVNGGQAKLQRSYSRRLEPEAEQVRYYSTSGNVPVSVTETRPSMPARESGYMKFPKVKQSKAYGQDDVQYSNYYDKPYREEYSAYA